MTRIGPVLLAGMVVGTVIVGSLLAFDAQASPASMPSATSLPKETYTAYSFQVSAVNSSYNISPSTEATLSFQITAPVPGTFYVGLIPSSEADFEVVGSSPTVSYSNGLQVQFPAGNVLSGSSIGVSAVLKLAPSTATQAMPMKFVVYEEDNGTYVGQEVDLTLNVN